MVDLKVEELQKYQEELQKINDKYQRQKELQQAIEDLQRATAQRTQRIYRDGIGFTYEADADAVRDAQENFEQILHDQTMDKIDEAIDALHELKDDTNVYDEFGELLGERYELPVIDLADALLKYNASNGTIQSALEEVRKQIYEDFQKTWIHRMVEVNCGIDDAASGETVWYSMGRMLMVNGSASYSATSQEIRISLVDLMASLMAERGSQMGVGMLIPAGSNMKGALAAIVAEFSPYKRYSIPEFEDTVPYDIEVPLGAYPFDALKELLNLFPYYEMFYDAEGVFTVQEIPTKISDPVDIGDDILDELLLSENTESASVNFSDVKNTTEIWGRSLDAMYTATSCTSSGTCYNLVIDDTFEKLVVGETYSFVPDQTSAAGQSLKIQDTTEHQIYTQAGDGTYTAIAAGAMAEGVPYCIRYAEQGFVLQGELEIHVIVQEAKAMPSATAQTKFKENNACRDVEWVINPDSPFACVENSINNMDFEIRQVLEGGEYDAIYTTQLALERAKYENWKKTRLQDSLTFESVLIPWIEVNDKVEYTSPITGETQTVLVQEVSFDFARWTMTVKGVRF